ncbi:hypothetical protein O7622_01140 [Micromonospora sp. WMMD1076]|uniref:hypothetical protein n=1 Tax=Micromonospora sp. WMMD1076 TaxID=3016103 RepID=UPI00249BDAB2|nr:hypothetical protein [Micromonospora sp. WMMD1076]WFF07235.1 hypothetical protein O7622_01140 [Micromonospora sp. WMMD1076]
MVDVNSHLNLSATGTGEDAVVVGDLNLSMLVHRLLLTAEVGEPPRLVLELSPRAYVVDAEGSVVGVSPAGHAALVALGWQPPFTPGQVGRCGHVSPALIRPAPPTHCALPAGHAGWHRDDDGAVWGTSVNGASLDGLLANVSRSLATAVDDAERAEAIEMLLDGWYAAWPDSAVTSPSFPLAAQLVRLLRPVSSTIAVSGRFARAAGAAHGQNDGRDWVRLRTGSGRQHEGHRSQSCPGDGVIGHQHDVRCVDPEARRG